MTYDDYIPAPVPNVYDPQRQGLIRLLALYRESQIAASGAYKGHWRDLMEAQVSEYVEEVENLTRRLQQRQDEATANRLARAKERLTPYATSKRYAFYQQLHNDEMAQHRQRLESRRKALNAALGLPEDFTEAAEYSIIEEVETTT